MLPSFDILTKVAAAYDLSVEQLMSRRRTQDIAIARQVAAYFLREINGISYPAIGRILGRDHTTILHAHEKISAGVLRDRKFKEFVDKLSAALKEAEIEVDVKNSGSITNDEVAYLHNTLLDYGLNNQRGKLETSEDILRTNKDLEITAREAGMLSKYRTGMTLDEIAPSAGVTRERVRQIIYKTLLKELGQKAKGGFNIDIREYVKSQKALHDRSRNMPEYKKAEILQRISSGTSIPDVLKDYKLTKNKFLTYFPQYADSYEWGPGKKRWSRFYDKCRGCGTTTTPHLRRGYCEKCLGGLRKKRREDAIAKFDGKCVRCGISRSECLRKYKRDFYLSRELTNESFAPLCRRCFLDLASARMVNKRWGRQHSR